MPAGMMELYGKNDNKLTAIFPKSFVIDVRMSSKYASQNVEIVKMNLRLGKSSRLLRRIAFLVFPCFGVTLAHWRKCQESVTW